jgi:D-glycero-D-manno-heptose 1,7-bisphosphate phosphatase
VATNQSGIARGLFDMDMLNRIHTKMSNAARDHGGEIDSIFFCPHGPDDNCECRKPRPGLFNEIASRLKTNLNSVYAVGDSERDVIAAREGGAVPVLVRTGKGERTLEKPGKESLEGVPVFDDLVAFTDSLLSGKLKA